jgi:hypothetical protein
MLYPFYHARLQPVFPSDRSSDMSIVLFHGGGLSKEQMDGLALSPERWRFVLPRWARRFFRQHPLKR